MRTHKSSRHCSRLALCSLFFPPISFTYLITRLSFITLFMKKESSAKKKSWQSFKGNPQELEKSGNFNQLQTFFFAFRHTNLMYPPSAVMQKDIIKRIFPWHKLRHCVKSNSPADDCNGNFVLAATLMCALCAPGAVDSSQMMERCWYCCALSSLLHFPCHSFSFAVSNSLCTTVLTTLLQVP